MGDIVERLRLLVPSDSSGAAFDAVNEITRLRNELHITQEWSARVIAGHEQDMTEITALRAENERLRAALQAWDDAVAVNLVMEGPRFNGVRWNKAAAAWELARAALEQKQ